MTTTYFPENHVKFGADDFMGMMLDFIGNGVVTPSTDFALTFPATPTMSFSVGAGTAYINGQRYRNYAGPYTPNASPLVNLTCAAADPSNPRIDLVEIGPVGFDPLATSPWSYGIIKIKTGTPAGSPVRPTADTGFLALYAIAVGAGVTSINAGNVTDLRGIIPLNNLSVISAALGNLTVNPALAGGSNTAPLVQILSWLCRQVLNMGGLTNYYDAVTAALLKAGGSMAGPINQIKGADIASASTTDIGAATGNFINITGNVAITRLGTIQEGTERVCYFTGTPTLTYDANYLLLPGAANIVVSAGDIAVFRSLGSNKWIMTSYMRASGLSLLTSGGTMSGPIAMGSSKITGLANGTVSGDAVHRGQFPTSYAANGYIKIPGLDGNFLVQFGNFTTVTGTKAVTFPTSFPNGCYGIAATLKDDQQGTCNIATISQSGFTAKSNIMSYAWYYIGVGY